MKWNTWLTNYFTFTRKERIGLLIITGFLLPVLLLPAFLTGKQTASPQKADTAWMAAVQALEIKQAAGKDAAENKSPHYYAYQRTTPSYGNETRATLFYFDPNTITAADWKKLGLRDKTIQTIANYLKKGGSFKKPEDLEKIYGLRSQDLDRLLPYVRITAPVLAEKSTASSNERKPFTREQNPAPYAKKGAAPVDINAADTTALIALPGIGSKLAARVIGFREKLGGFYSVDQVKETYGLPDSTFQKIKPLLQPGNTPVKKIDINTGTLDILKAHPYIRYELAKIIIAYRNEHGPYKQVEELKKLQPVTDEIFKKIAPYLKTE